jgi:dTDP-4-amino-4,6-dideoxy-D-galactose acyltransferase
MISLSKFESEITKTNIFKFEEVGNVDFDSISNELNLCNEHIITKVSSLNFKLINLFLKNGFKYSCSTTFLNCTFCKKSIDFNKTDDGIIEIINNDQIESLLEISDEAFLENNRYANDSFLKIFNISIHREWILNSINGFADYSCAANLENKPIAFGTLHKKGNISTIGLLAVSSAERNQGFATKIINHLKKKSKDLKCSEIRVATESMNYPALNMYIKNGFIIYNTEIALYREKNL